MQLCELPDELIVAVLGFLEAEDLAWAASVSRKMRRLANDRSLWRRLAENHYLPLLIYERHVVDEESAFEYDAHMSDYKEFFARITSTLARFKVVVVGDEGVGKTSLIQSILSLQRNLALQVGLNDWDPHSSITIMLGPSPAKITFVDTDEPILPPKQLLKKHPDTDLFLVCFSLADMKSFKSLFSKV